VTIEPAEPPARREPRTARTRPARDSARDRRKKERKEPERTAEAPAIDPAAVQSKFQTVLREYKRFAQGYGARLEQEWTELATFAQYARTPDRLTELDRRLDRFRALMRASK
jgi:hypothetical protein